MLRGMLVRWLLVVVLAVASGLDAAQAQGPCRFIDCPPNGPFQTPTPGSIPGQAPRDHNNKVIGYVVGGIAAGILGWAIGTRILSEPQSPDRPTFPYDPQEPPLQQTSLPPPTQLPSNIPPNVPPTGPTGPSTAQLRSGFTLPPPGAHIVLDEVMLDIPASVGERTLDIIAARHTMTRLETRTFRLTGRTLHRWHLDGGGTVQAMIRGLSREQQIAGAQAIYLYAMTEEAAQANADQYAPEKLGLPEAHRLATGDRVLVALIDSGVDANHPDLAGAIVANFDAATEDTTPHPHGTGMAGAIAARRTVVSSAPGVGLLTVRAFNTKANSGEGTTFNIIKGLDWAAERGARVINMSFAGPTTDPRLRDALGRAARRGIVLVAAAGNAGPTSPPLFPAADPNVIAVTATDENDALFPGANRGSHIAVAAPGVDILVPGPDGTYQFTTGTSVASAEVAGVVALLIERNPSITPSEVRRILMRTAKSFGKGHEKEYGAGLVNAYLAVQSAKK
jgi:subtilisin family serine protease